MKKVILIASMLASLLTGCASTPATLELSQSVFDVLQASVPDDMRNTNLVATVLYDEEFVGRQDNQKKAFMAGASIANYTAEYYMRAVHATVGSTEEMLWVKKGDRTFRTVAMVPDHLPRLKAGDIVEIRQTSYTRGAKDLSKTGEGSMVLQVLCKIDSPNFQACVDKLPSMGKRKAAGQTKTYYPKSAKEYGFTFSQRYDKEGNLLKAFPPR